MKTIISISIFTLLAVGSFATISADNCQQDAYKLLESHNKQCYATYGKNGEKDRDGWKKCKRQGKEKYEAARAKCK